MTLIMEKKGLVVERTERVDPDSGSVKYELMFVVDMESDKYVTFQISTDDPGFYGKFAIDKNYELKFLDEAKVDKEPSAKMN